MKILFVSDFHYFHPWFEWVLKEAPAHDLLVIAGDLLNQNDPSPHAKQVARVISWLSEVHGPLCVSTGNHDREWNSRENRWMPASWLGEIRRDDLWIGGSIAEFGGLPILSTDYREPPADPSATVWVTHNPPSGSTVGRSADGWDGGDGELEEALLRHRPALLLCGHVHSPMRWHDRVGDTLCINAGMTLHARMPNHVLLDTEEGTVERHSEVNMASRCERLEIGSEFGDIAERLNPTAAAGPVSR